MRAIGQGGMATVYLAIQESFEREVALKVMAPELAREQDFSERFLREARIVARLVHPNIVHVYDVGIENGHHYLSMQYIEGQDLKTLLPEMSAQQIVKALAEMAIALDYAGAKGYVHRDVKPDNIMIQGEDGRAILMDFGIARASRPDNSMTRTGITLGTPHYMSPEQARGLEVDTRSDLYSLGVLFYYTLIGKVPFDADSPVTVGIMHLTDPIPKLPAPLECYQSLLNKMMAKEPAKRFQTGRELSEALQKLATEPLQKWHQRKDFKFHSAGPDTPVRGKVTPTPADILATGETVVASQSGARAAQSGASAARTMVTPAPAESLSIPREDLAERRAGQQRRSSFPLLALILVVIIAAGAGYYVYNGGPPGFLAAGQGEAQVAVQESVPEAADSSQSQLAGTGEPAGATEQEQAAPQATAEEGTADQGAGEQSDRAQAQSDQPEADAAKLKDLWLQIGTVASEVEQQPQRRGTLIGLYRQVLDIDPGNTEALQGLETQKYDAIDQAHKLIGDKQFDSAQTLLSDLLSWYPKLEGQQPYTDLQQALKQGRDISALLQTAGQYLQANKLLKPDGENAVESYRAVLALDKDNAEARAGLAKVADRYRQLALKQRRNKAYDKALALVGSGLSVVPDDSDLKKLRGSLQRQLKSEQRIQQLLGEAKTLADQGKLFAKPNSAAQRYLDALAIDAHNSAARQGLRQLLQERYQQVEQALGKRDFKRATVQVEESLKVVPRDERLAALSLEIESSKPAVDKLLLSGSAIQSMQQPQDKSVKADRVLYIGFHYKNLPGSTTVFQALLFDGSRTLQIAAVPVVVTGTTGDARFRIDRPVEGFTEGGYHIDILLAGQRIYTQAFTIGK